MLLEVYFHGNGKIFPFGYFIPGERPYEKLFQEIVLWEVSSWKQGDFLRRDGLSYPASRKIVLNQDTLPHVTF